MAQEPFRKTFEQAGTFATLSAAEAFLRDRGFSVGSNQRGAPTGVMFGDYSISKWRNMTDSEQDALHGVIEAGDHREGPVRVRINSTAPQAAIDAFTETAS